VCRHVLAVGMLRRMSSERRQRGVLAALWAWTAAAQQHRRALAARMLHSWRCAVCKAGQVLQQARDDARRRSTIAVLCAWHKLAEQQVSDC
jgi:hypothetical protein